MRKNTVVYPGTFDPIHKGHVDLVERASNLLTASSLALLRAQRSSRCLQKNASR